MEDHPKSDVYLLHAEANRQGAQQKMEQLRRCQLRGLIPLKHQIMDMLMISDGLSIQEISQRLCLNTKTCAKLMDEMTQKWDSVFQGAHRQGRVYEFKYHYVHQIPESAEKSELNLNEMENELIKEALSINLKQEKPSNRSRVTQQSIDRCNFILKKIREAQVISIFELKEAIRKELEPDAQYKLDKKTVLRILWKLQRINLVRHMCFRITLCKDCRVEAHYLGDDASAQDDDKAGMNRNSSNFYNQEGDQVVYKTLVTLPEINEDDDIVRSYHILTNPTNRKQAEGLQVYPTGIKSKALKRIILKQTKEYKMIKTEDNDNLSALYCQEDTHAGSYFDDEQTEYIKREINGRIFAKYLVKFLRRARRRRLLVFLSLIRIPFCHVAFNSLVQQIENRRETRGNSLNDPYCSNMMSAPSRKELIYGRHVRVTPPVTQSDSQITLRKIFLFFISKPGVSNISKIAKWCKSLNIEIDTLMDLLGSYGMIKRVEGRYYFNKNIMI